MPILGGLLVNIFSGLVAWFSMYVTRKVAFVSAAITGMTALTVGLFVVFRGILTALNAAATTGAHQMFIDCLGMAIPPNASFCISTYITMWTACTVYTWQRDLLHLAVRA